MWTAVLAMQNLLDGGTHDVWSVNTEAIYHEEGEILDDLLDLEFEPVEPVREPAQVSLPAAQEARSA